MKQLSYFSRCREYVSLFFLSLYIKWRNCVDYVQVILRYYGDIPFLRADLLLLFSYLFDNPYRVSARFSREKEEKELYTFGETPLTTLEEIAHRCALSSQDTVLELGCGRGRTSFWLNRFIGCCVIGVDCIPTFIERAQHVQNKCGFTRVTFLVEDIRSIELDGTTVIYLYGTCYHPTFILQLIEHFKQLPQGVRVISVSYPLTDYQTTPEFELLSSFPARFTWGSTEVYLQVKL